MDDLDWVIKEVKRRAKESANLLASQTVNRYNADMVSILAGKFLRGSELKDLLAPVVASGVGYALIGGAALASHGCPRLISNVDIAVDVEMGLNLVPERQLKYGGSSYLGGRLKVIRRADEYAGLYRDAILTARMGLLGYPVASIEHLGAMKLSMREGHHRLDLEWILLRNGTDFRKLQDLVYAHVGGRFGVDFLEDIKAEAEMEAELDLNRSASSYP